MSGFGLHLGFVLCLGVDEGDGQGEGISQWVWFKVRFRFRIPCMVRIGLWLELGFYFSMRLLVFFWICVMVRCG